MLQRYF
jgi:nuclear cap-binding protein subunit 1